VKRACLASLAALALVTGCPGLTGGAGDRPDGHRLVEGELVTEGQDVLGRQLTGVQVAAVSVREADGAFVPDVFASDVIAPQGENGVAPFVVAVPVERAFHIVLQLPAAGGSAPGEWLGVLRFSDGRANEVSLIPAGGEDLDLGSVRTIDGDPLTVADNLLDAGSAGNPLSQVEHDADGVSDLLDEDDDDDLIPDDTDADVAGDGVEDALQLLEALPDEDSDGVPDAFEA
jgi:hypothetical protein